MFLQPQIKQIIVNGKVLLNDGRRRIDLKRPIIDAFPELLDSRQKVQYSMELYFNKKIFLERINGYLEKGTIPILLFFSKINFEE